jgi:hypothetical protein
MLHPAERAVQSVLWNREQRAPLATSSQGAAAFIKMSGTRLRGRALSSWRGIGDETGCPCRGAIAAVREA